MKIRECVIREAYQTEVRESVLPEPGEEQVLVETRCSAISAGTELAVFTGSHQWLRDPKMSEWKFPFKPGYSAAGVVKAVGTKIQGLKPGDRIAYPGNHASGELLTLGHERGRWWKMPDGLSFDKAAWACVARYGMGAAIRAGLTLGRSAAVLGLGVIGQFALRCLKAAGAYPVIGMDSILMRRDAATAGGADGILDSSQEGMKEELLNLLGGHGAEIVADATGIPDAIPTAMSLTCDGGQVIIVGSPRGLAREVNFYDDLHRRYIEISGAHGNMLFEPAHHRLAGAWDIHKAQHWLLASLANGRLSLDRLVTHNIQPEELGMAYRGLLKEKEKYLGVMVQW